MSLNPTHPEVFPIRADENSKKVYGEDWHTDASCDEAPPLGSVLRLTELPPVGGDTMFSGMYAAYDLLSPTMQTFLEGLTAVHDGNRMFRGREFEEKEYPRSEHPVVATHPETGRKLIFVNRMYVSHIVQLSARESEAVLQMLYRLVETPEIQCRFVWQPNSVVFWDNRCVQHKAVFDYFPHRRIGTRVQVCGSRPVAGPTETQAPHAAARGHLVAA